jgi:membrane dipeptidase
VLVDLSHVSDQTFNDALAVTMAPVVLSHSSCRAICDHPRNVTDDMLRALARNGGVIQITFVDSFLSQELRNAERAVQAERDARIAEEQKKYPDDEAARREAARRIRREYQDRMPKVSWEKIIEHIDHAVKVAGVDHVGLGSDFDGATMPQGMEDVTQLPKITDALLKKGYSEKDVEKILGGNLLRVMEQVEQVSRKLQGRKAEKSQ